MFPGWDESHRFYLKSQNSTAALDGVTVTPTSLSLTDSAAAHALSHLSVLFTLLPLPQPSLPYFRAFIYLTCFSRLNLIDFIKCLPL